MIRWLFFDLGNVLVIDEPYVAALWQVLSEACCTRGLEFTPATLMAERERLVQDEADATPCDTLGRRLLGEAAWQAATVPIRQRFHEAWGTYNVPLPEVARGLATLRRPYRLALAANQPPGCRAHLDHLGLMPYFKVVGLSAE